jgi:two-component system phosphate regulon response regulator PhoB
MFAVQMTYGRRTLARQAEDMNETILIVDDERDVVDLLAYNLQKEGFKTITASNGRMALKKAREEGPALITLDIMMPQLDGAEVCKQLKADYQTSAIPIIMLSARNEEVDRIVGLELGADDYVTKPFSPREFTLRIKNLIGRLHDATASSDVLRSGDLVVDRVKFEASLNGRSLDLTTMELKLLLKLMEQKGRLVTRDQLLMDVWGYASDEDRRKVDTHVKRLRAKLGRATNYIVTVRGFGYRFGGAGQ